MALHDRRGVPLWRVNLSGTERRLISSARILEGRWIFKSLLAVCLALFFSAHCNAQEFPRWELSGGFSYYLVGKTPGRTITTTAHGPQAGLAYSINNYFRIEGEFDADFSKRIMDLAAVPPGFRHYNSKMLLGLVGPEFVFRRPDRKLQVFGHYLTGIAYARDNQVPTAGSPTGISLVPATTGSSWVNAVGSGVDLKFPHQVSFRMLEVDWVRTNFPNNPHSNWRFVTGFVLRLGQRQ